MHNQNDELDVEYIEQFESSYQLDFRSLLYQAAVSGNWKAVEGVQKYFWRNAYTTKITKNGDRLLHIAAVNKQVEFARKLVKCLPYKEYLMTLINHRGDTAFHAAAKSGCLEIVEFMYAQCEQLTKLCNEEGKIPLEIAFLAKEKKMIKYLYPITKPEECCTDEDCFTLLMAAIQLDMFDIARDIFIKKREAFYSDHTRCVRALKVLAQKPTPSSIEEPLWHRIPFMSRSKSARAHRTWFQMQITASTLVKNFWAAIQLLPEDTLWGLIQTYLIFHDAARTGNVEFLVMLTRTHPNMLWIRNDEEQTVLQVAVKYRQDKVFGFLCHIGAVKDYINYFRGEQENIFHLVGQRPPRRILNMVPGAALQMQRELLWFKEVEKNFPLVLDDEEMQLGANKKPPEELFLIEHEGLQKDGEKWMKETATSCMLVSTLVATVAFAAAFTVPGGYKSESGVPILLKDKRFSIFVISDAMGMFSSSSSIMMFLSILTSRFSDQDFLVALPKRLAFGLVSLFVSVACMVLSFSATFFLEYKEEKQVKVPQLVATLACAPVIFYIALHIKLWIDIIRAAWTSSFLFKYRSKHRLSL